MCLAFGAVKPSRTQVCRLDIPSALAVRTVRASDTVLNGLVTGVIGECSSGTFFRLFGSRLAEASRRTNVARHAIPRLRHTSATVAEPAGVALSRHVPFALTGAVIATQAGCRLVRALRAEEPLLALAAGRVRRAQAVARREVVVVGGPVGPRGSHAEPSRVALACRAAQTRRVAVHAAGARQAVGQADSIRAVVEVALGAGELGGELGSVGAVVALGAVETVVVDRLFGAVVPLRTGEALRLSDVGIVGAASAALGNGCPPRAEVAGCTRASNAGHFRRACCVGATLTVKTWVALSCWSRK